ncbi:MAG: tetratricopeptide repeat protein [Promethearchaeota archaeon]
MQKDTRHGGNLGVVYGRLGEYQKAFDCSRKIVRIETKHGPVWHNMGTTYKKLGDNRKTVGCYNKARLVHSG